MSQDSAPAEKGTSRFVLPDWAWKFVQFILYQIAGQIVGWLLRRIGPTLRRVWSSLGNEKFWPTLFVVLLLTSEWLRGGVNPSTLWNFPPVRSPFPRLSLYAAPLLDNLIKSWMGALAFSIMYCSRSYLKRFSWGTTAGELSRRLMLISFLLYPALVAWFSLAAEGSFLIPAWASWAQVPFWLFASYPLGTIVIRSFETALGTRIFGKRGFLTPVISRSSQVGAIGIELIGNTLMGRYYFVYSRLTGRTMEIPVGRSARPAIVSFIGFLTIISTTLAWSVGLTSMYDLFSVFGTVLWGMIASALILGLWKRRRDSEEEKGITRVPKRFWGKFKFYSSS